MLNTSNGITSAPPSFVAPKRTRRSRARTGQSDRTTLTGRSERASASGQRTAQGIGEAFMNLQQRNRIDRLTDGYSIARDGTGGNRSGLSTKKIARGKFDRQAAQRSEDKTLRRKVSKRGLKMVNEFRALRDQRVGIIKQDLATLGQDQQHLDRLDQANSRRDGRIGHGDLTRAAFEHDREHGFNPGAGTKGDTPWADESTRRPRLIRSQEQAVLDSVVTGRPVNFTNKLGQTEKLQFDQARGGGDSSHFSLSDANGNWLSIESELTSTNTRVALARLGEYYSQTPSHLRGAVKSIRLNNEFLQHRGKSHWANGTYGERPGHINFYRGLGTVNEQVFHHEVGHAIGDQVDQVNDLFRLRPPGWDRHRGPSPSDYAKEHGREDFAESYSKFKKYVDTGRLRQFRRRYPDRSRQLEAIYFRR